MNNPQTVNRNFEAVAWGTLFIWWGVIELAKNLPNGTGLIGIGLILLGLNAARYFSGISMNGFTTTCGILALVWGGLELVGVLISLPFEIPVFAIVLIVLGVIILAPVLAGKRNS